MKCKECDSCRKGFFESQPDAYVCIGVKEPFVIRDINHECTEYPEKNENENFFLVGGGGKVGEFFVPATDKMMCIPLEPTYRQLSKALLSKENAEPDEILLAVSQLKDELEAVKRERDAVKESAVLQSEYKKLVNSKHFTKRALCDLCVPFRDRYNLADAQVLRIARQEITLIELINILFKPPKEERPMTDREKVVKLLNEAFIEAQRQGNRTTGYVADHLLANGVTVQQQIHKSTERKPDCKSCEHSYWHDQECSDCNDKNGFKYYVRRGDQQK